MKICILISVLLLAGSVQAANQGEPHGWIRTFGGSGDDYGTFVSQTTDEGYLILANTKSYGEGERDIWLIKTDAHGNKLWSRTYGGTQIDYGTSVQLTSDGGYIITGSTMPKENSRDQAVWLIKTDSQGNKLWDKTFGGSREDIGNSVDQTKDGGYIIVGRTISSDKGGYCILLIKTDSIGNRLWSKVACGTGPNYGNSVRQTEDGGYIIAGAIGDSSNHGGKGKEDAWLIKTDDKGNIIWSMTYGSEENDYGYAAQQTADGGYILIGKTDSLGSWIIKTDAKGNTLWSNTFDEIYMLNYVQETSDGNYVIIGSTSWLNSEKSDIRLVKIDAKGNGLWSKTFNKMNSNNGNSILQTLDGGYLLVGSTGQFTRNKEGRLSGNYDVLLIKTDANGNV